MDFFLRAIAWLFFVACWWLSCCGMVVVSHTPEEFGNFIVPVILTGLVLMAGYTILAFGKIAAERPKTVFAILAVIILVTNGYALLFLGLNFMFTAFVVAVLLFLFIILKLLARRLLESGKMQMVLWTLTLLLNAFLSIAYTRFLSEMHADVTTRADWGYVERVQLWCYAAIPLALVAIVLSFVQSSRKSVGAVA